jgi:hypothetical protein
MAIFVVYLCVRFSFKYLLAAVPIRALSLYVKSRTDQNSVSVLGEKVARYVRGDRLPPQTVHFG